MNYYDQEVNGRYNRERVKAEMDQIRLEARAMQVSKSATPSQPRRLLGAWAERLASIEKSLQHQLAVLLHPHPRPAVAHSRRRR